MSIARSTLPMPPSWGMAAAQREPAGRAAAQTAIWSRAMRTVGDRGSRQRQAACRDGGNSALRATVAFVYGGLADKIEGAVIPTDKANTFNYVTNPSASWPAITPWNSPLMLTPPGSWRRRSPGLRTAVVKPSEFVGLDARILQIDRGGRISQGVVNVVTGFGADVGEPLALHPGREEVAFTGGELSGQRVYECGQGLKQVNSRTRRQIGPTSCSTTRNSTVLDEAISGIFAATGQTCIAGSRLLVQDSIHDAFMDRLLALAKTAKMGDPMNLETQVGPVTTQPQFQKILGYIDVAKGEGAKCVLGGAKAMRPECGSGWFIEPTIFDGVNNKMRIAQEEVFGPVLSVIRFKDEDEAVAIANDSLYGLAAGVWTQGIKRSIKMAERLQAGTVWVNTYRAISFTSPFGGYKRSGVGRENGQDAIWEYLQTKSVWISTADEVPNPFVMR
ncbi:MAG: aldehyde dehydrogenase family protein [Methylocystis sp.]